jgi:3-oxoadipate enol-lactonase
MKAKTNGIELNYSVQGEGPWVVMSHSLACDSGMWDGQVAALATRYKVLCFDTRGHGKSDAPEGPYTLETLAEDVHGLLHELGIERCHWVGLSMGGMIGQVFALNYPGILQSIVLADTTSRYPADALPLWQGRIRTARERGMGPLVEGTLQRWFTEPYRLKHASVMTRIATQIRSTPVEGFAGCCAAIPMINVTEKLKTLKLPALVIVGEQDAATPVEMARLIQQAIPGAELAIIPSASHLACIEQPEEFNRLVLAFLDKQH